MGLVTVQINRSCSGYVQGNQTITVTDDNGITANPTIIAAQPGVLTTHTTNATGTMTMTNSSHGLTTGQRVDLYWTGGQCYGAVLGTVSGTTVPIASVSGGSNLPASSTAIVVGIATSVPFSLIGSNLQALVATGPQQGYFVYNDGTSDDLAILIVAGGVSIWAVQDPSVNPLAGDTPTKVYVSHSYTVGSVTGMTTAAIVH